MLPFYSETIAQSSQGSNHPIIAVLDTKEALDSVWHDNVFMMLLDHGCNMNVWLTLRNHHGALQGHVRVTAVGASQWLDLQHGVFQGALFSMW